MLVEGIEYFITGHIIKRKLSLKLDKKTQTLAVENLGNEHCSKFNKSISNVEGIDNRYI